MKKIPYVKMQGAGNDFVILDNRQLGLDPACFSALADLPDLAGFSGFAGLSGSFSRRF